MKLSIRQKLLGAFAVDLLLMFLLGGFALRQLALVGEKARQVESSTIPAIRNVDDIRGQVSLYRTRQLEFMVLTNPADRHRLERLLKEAEGAMVELIAEHHRLISGEPSGGVQRTEVTGALGAVEELWRVYVRATHERFLPSVRLSNTGTVQPAFSRLNPTYLRLEDAVDRLAGLEEQSAQRAMEMVRRTDRESRLFILADTSLSILLSATVGLALAATLARRLRRLSSATRQVTRGDFDPRISDQAGDELSHLAEHFNEMVISLRRQRTALEERNEELQQSLERQRGLTEDLVKRKESEEAADRARAEAEARDSAKSLFLATMSHELRTPLNAMLGFTQIMQLEAGRRGDGGMTQDLQRIDAAGKHLLTVINNLLDFSKAEQGKLEIEALEFPAADLVREVVAIVSPLATERGNRLVTAEVEDVGLMRSDPVKLRQVLFNLLSNAVKFTEAGTVTVRLERLARQDSADRLRFLVEDTGIGIDEEHLDLIFEPFRQAESSTTRRFGGTGLGLVVSRQLTQLLGGEIGVESRVGLGSTFSVTLPARLPDDLGARAA